MLERMIAKGLSPDAQSFSFLLEVYSLCGRFDKAEDLRVKMDEHGLISSVSAYNALLRYRVRSGRVDIAVDLLDDLLKKGVKITHNTMAALISGYGKSGALVNERILAHVRESDKLQLDPKHGLYTALLAAIPRCKSHKEAYSFLEILQKVDCPIEICSILREVVSGNADEEDAWTNLQNKFHYIDMNGFNLETQRNLQNAVIDALWWFGWEIRALRVVKIGLDQGILGQVFKWSKTEWTLNISVGSVGAAQVLLLMWIASMRKLVKKGTVEIPSQIRIILAEDWQLRLNENKAAIDAVQAKLDDLGATYSRTDDQKAFELSSSEFSSWLKQDQLDKKLFLVDNLRKCGTQTAAAKV
jgi:pentatricopeptide repeat protein